MNAEFKQHVDSHAMEPFTELTVEPHGYFSDLAARRIVPYLDDQDHSVDWLNHLVGQLERSCERTTEALQIMSELWEQHPECRPFIERLVAVFALDMVMTGEQDEDETPDW
ncbi:hypothetical protein [Aeoliella sp.]|uniref:hypothetical protein n=1 Tax=Aeoliella sp. TaxID=2795800 RepID=UPI003CCBFE5C